MDERDRLTDVTLDPASLSTASPDAEHERRIAIFDLLEKNKFSVEGENAGPYALRLSIIDQRLVLDVTGSESEQKKSFILSLAPFRKVIRDYFMVCDSYYDAIRKATPQQIEAVDMGRRALHNEGSELLIERLDGKVRVDHDTARRLFTLICALHARP